MKSALFYWCLGANALSFFLMGFDKRQARRGGSRISEKRLFLTAALGGAVGAILGMYVFHHKTRRWYFKWGLPAILLFQLGVLWLQRQYGTQLL